MVKKLTKPGEYNARVFYTFLGIWIRISGLTIELKSWPLLSDWAKLTSQKVKRKGHWLHQKIDTIIERIYLDLISKKGCFNFENIYFSSNRSTPAPPPSLEFIHNLEL